MKHVIYFHGFASSPNSTKVKELRKHYDSVFAPDVPYKYDPINLLRQVADYLTKTANAGDQVLFVGTSLGGYWAAIMADLFDGNAVVFNPSVDPAVDMVKYIGKNTNFSTGETFYLSAENVSSFSYLDNEVNACVAKAVICTQDKEVDAVTAINFFENGVYVVSDDHQFKDIGLFLKYVALGFDSIKEDNMCLGNF